VCEKMSNPQWGIQPPLALDTSILDFKTINNMPEQHSNFHSFNNLFQVILAGFSLYLSFIRFASDDLCFSFSLKWVAKDHRYSVNHRHSLQQTTILTTITTAIRMQCLSALGRSRRMTGLLPNSNLITSTPGVRIQ